MIDLLHCDLQLKKFDNHHQQQKQQSKAKQDTEIGRSSVNE